MYKVWFLFIFFISCTVAISAKTSAQPELARWQSDMLKYGDMHCKRLSDLNLTFDQHLADTYYDAAWVFYQIADYTKDQKWLGCAEKALTIYKEHATKNNGKLPAYWLFPNGLAEKYERTKDETGKAAFQLLLSNGSFVNASGWNDSNQNQEQYLRETAYALALHIQSQRFGIPRNFARINQLKAFLLGHLDQQYIKRTGYFRKPFMAGLAADALILYYEQIQKDPAIITMLTKVADYLRTQMWLGTGFQYTDNPAEGIATSPDLNLLIAPMYSWLYEQTMLPRMGIFSDEVFKAGVLNSYLTGGKQFNQNYRLSFKYVKKPAPVITPIPLVIDSALVCKEVLEAAKICQGK